MISDWRALTSYENDVLEFLLSKSTSHREGLMLQLRNCKVRTIDKEHSIEFSIHDSASAAPGKYGVVAEAGYPDDDGIEVHTLLHIRDGKLWELEFYKDDGSPIVRFALPSEMLLY